MKLSELREQARAGALDPPKPKQEPFGPFSAADIEVCGGDWPVDGLEPEGVVSSKIEGRTADAVIIDDPLKLDMPVSPMERFPELPPLPGIPMPALPSLPELKIDLPKLELPRIPDLSVHMPDLERAARATGHSLEHTVNAFKALWEGMRKKS